MAADSSAIPSHQSQNNTASDCWTEWMNRFFLDRDARERRTNIEQLTQTTPFTKDRMQDDTLLAQHIFADPKCSSCTPCVGIPVEVGSDVGYDLELFQTYKPLDATAPLLSTRKQGDLLHAIDETSLVGGHYVLKQLLMRPDSSVQHLDQRREALTRLAEDMEKNSSQDAAILTLKDELSRLKDYESSVLWLYDQHDDTMLQIIDMVYFRTWFLKPGNASAPLLTGYNIYRILLSPTIGILSPIIYFLIPYLVLRMKLKIKISLWTYLKFTYQAMFAGDVAANLLFGGTEKSWWLSKARYLSVALSLLFYFQGVFNSLDISRALYKVCRMISHRMNDVLHFAQGCKRILETYWKPLYAEAFGMVSAASPLNLDSSFAWGWVYKEPAIAHPKFWFLRRHFGRFLKLYKTFPHAEFKTLLQRVYVLDTMHSILELKRVRGFQMPTFVRAIEGDVNSEDVQPLALTGAVLQMDAFWHPGLESTTLVKNTLNQDAHLMITGPNAGGKSTLIKAILTNVWLCQTLCMGAFASARMCPFAYINTQITIPDTKGKESLFEAEMFRCRHTIERLKHYASLPSSNNKCLVAMDEIFNSTNPVEGISGAYAVAKKLTTFPMLRCFITTHYTYLTKLQKASQGKFINMRMDAAVGTGTDILYSYRLQPGVSRQYIALELLRKNGFDLDLIKDAIAVKKQLLTRPKAKVEESIGEKEKETDVLSEKNETP